MEDLFILEAELRAAAVNFTEWERASCLKLEDRKGRDQARSRLRNAARAFANYERTTDDLLARAAKKR